MPDEQIILALSQRMDDHFTGISNRMDDKMMEIKKCVNDKCEAIRTHTVTELHRVHERQDAFQKNCADSRMNIISQVSKLSVHVKWIVYILIGSGVAIGGSAGAISFLGG